MNDHEQITNPANPGTVLELTVNNHPGVMSHVCGLFSRRGFNLDSILCMPLPNSDKSRIWLRLREGERLRQIESQLRKLHDVHEVRQQLPEHAVFGHLERNLSMRV